MDRPGPARPLTAYHHDRTAPVALSARRQATRRQAARTSTPALAPAPGAPPLTASPQNPEKLTSAINIVVSRASAEAIARIESLGGTVTTRFYSPTSIKRVLRGDSHPTVSLQSPPSLVTLASASRTGLVPSPILAALQAAPEESKQEALLAVIKHVNQQFKYRLPDPTARKDIEYYRDPAHRGYLAHLLSEGESPSLFFKPPGEAKDKKKVLAKRQAAKASADNRLF